MEVILLQHEKALAWCARNLTSEPNFHDKLVPAICAALKEDKMTLRWQVGKKFQDQEDFTWLTVSRWIECSVLSAEQFYTVMTSEGSHVDGLFIWLASIMRKSHLNFVHANSVWTL